MPGRAPCRKLTERGVMLTMGSGSDLVDDDYKGIISLK